MKEVCGRWESTLALLNGLGELVDGGRDLESAEKDPLLSLQKDIAGPLDEPGNIPLW